MENISDKERYSNAKLSESAINEIRTLYAAGACTQANLALRFGITQGQISRIVNHKHWKRVTGDD